MVRAAADKKQHGSLIRFRHVILTLLLTLELDNKYVPSTSFAYRHQHPFSPWSVLFPLLSIPLCTLSTYHVNGMLAPHQDQQVNWIPWCTNVSGWFLICILYLEPWGPQVPALPVNKCILDLKEHCLIFRGFRMSSQVKYRWSLGDHSSIVILDLGWVIYLRSGLWRQHVTPPTRYRRYCLMLYTDPPGKLRSGIDGLWKEFHP